MLYTWNQYMSITHKKIIPQKNKIMKYCITCIKFWKKNKLDEQILLSHQGSHINY